MSFSGMDRAEADDDMSDDGSQMLGEKKRRLNLEQVKALEKSFELGNKLEPQRKMQLARALGLQPRQIAIWFQNRRARWKTKQLEKDYDVLKRQYEALKADNEGLKSQNNKLHTQVRYSIHFNYSMFYRSIPFLIQHNATQLLSLKTRESTGPINLNKENEGSWSNVSENSCEVKTSTDTSSLFPHQRIPTPIAPSLTHLVHRPDHNLPGPNECFANMFGSIEETPEFWPWPEQHHFN